MLDGCGQPVGLLLLIVVQVMEADEEGEGAETEQNQGEAEGGGGALEVGEFVEEDGLHFLTAEDVTQADGEEDSRAEVAEGESYGAGFIYQEEAGRADG